MRFRKLTIPIAQHLLDPFIIRTVLRAQLKIGFPNFLRARLQFAERDNEMVVLHERLAFEMEHRHRYPPSIFNREWAQMKKKKKARDREIACHTSPVIRAHSRSFAVVFLSEIHVHWRPFAVVPLRDAMEKCGSS